MKLFQGDKIANIPSCSGLYAWYYKPLVINEREIIRALSSFLDNSPKLSVEIEMRYGLKLVSKSSLNAEIGSQKQSALVSQADSFLIWFFKSDLVQNFSRPIYIGVAKDRYKRIYNQHYSDLLKMYDISESSYRDLSRYLSVYPDSTVQEVMTQLHLSYSFALEARVRNIAPRDLAVSVFTTNSLPNNIDSDDLQADTPDRRQLERLERLLHLIADPVYGRK